MITEEEISNKVEPKWTQEQVKSLAAYQESNTFFPFVCLDNHVLTAKEGGLYCFECDYFVPWAYDWTLDWSWKLLEPPEGAGDRAKLPPDIPSGSAAIAMDEPGSKDKDI